MGQAGGIGSLEDFYDALYGAAIDPALWPEAMERWRRATSASGANMYVFDWSEGASHQGRFVGYADDVERLLTPELRAQDPWLIAAHSNAALMERMRSSGAMFVGHQAVEPGDFDRSTYYAEIGRRCDISDTLTVLAGNGDWTIGLIANSGGARRTFDADDLTLAQTVLPAIRRVVAIQARLVEAATSAPFAAQWDESSVACIAIRGLTVAYANPAAAAELSRGRIVRVLHGRVALADPQANAMLAAFRTAGDAGPRHRACTAEDGNGGRWLIHLIRLSQPRGSLLERLRLADPVVLCLATPLSGYSAGRAAAIDGLAALTPAERDVLQHLMSGFDITQTAARSGRSRETVRTMVKTMRAKIGAASIEDLLRIGTALMPF